MSLSCACQYQQLHRHPEWIDTLVPAYRGCHGSCMCMSRCMYLCVYTSGDAEHLHIWERGLPHTAHSAAVFHCAGIIADNFADEVILEPTEIAKHYLKTFFFLDLISSLPLDYILVSVSPETSVNQLVHAGMVRWVFPPIFSSTWYNNLFLENNSRNDPNNCCS